MLPPAAKNTQAVPSSHSSIPRKNLCPGVGEYEERQESDSLPRMAGGSGDNVVEVRCGGSGGDPGAYAAVLKRKLDLYCATVAKSMTGDGERAILFTNSHVIDYADSQDKPANIGTSKEQSDDNGDIEETTDPANAKKMRRMLSNRESARRSRKRKQTHLNDLESQVSRLTAENASLLKRLADMTQKYKDATLDNRNLTVNVEMMRRKCSESEEAVRRVTGASMLLLPTTFEMPGTSMPSSCASEVASAAVPVQESMQHSLQAPLQGDQMMVDLPNATIPLTSGEMHTMAASLRRLASLENLQKRIHRDSVYSGAALQFSDPEALASDK